MRWWSPLPRTTAVFRPPRVRRPRTCPRAGGKGWIYEGGIREPFIVRWPGVTQAGSVCKEPVMSTDFFPTFVKAAGEKPKGVGPIDGVDLMPLLKGGESLSRDALYWHYPHYSNQGGFPSGAIRMGTWKMIERYEDGQVHLYDLSKDLGEREDLSKVHPGQVAKMPKNSTNGTRTWMRNSSDPRGKTEKSLGGLNAGARFSGPGPMTIAGKSFLQVEDDGIFKIRTHADGPSGKLPLSAEMLKNWPSGDLFGLSQNAGMGWSPKEMLGAQVLILNSHGGIRKPDGSPIALGYHTGHWEIGLLAQAAASELKGLGAVPFAAHVSDPCDGRSQGTTAMFDSLAYRNDASLVMRRLVRSLPTARALMGVATCDKSMPAMMMTLASFPELPPFFCPEG